MIVFAIDPGPVKSAYCCYDAENSRPLQFGTYRNDNGWTGNVEADIVVIEKVASYGMPVGESIFDTCIWVGRFIEKISQWDLDFALMTRGDVKLHLCGTKRAKDSNVIQVLKDRFGEKGTKKKPGILYGIKADEWQALALAVTYAETKNTSPK